MLFTHVFAVQPWIENSKPTLLGKCVFVCVCVCACVCLHCLATYQQRCKLLWFDKWNKSSAVARLCVWLADHNVHSNDCYYMVCLYSWLAQHKVQINVCCYSYWYRFSFHDALRVSLPCHLHLPSIWACSTLHIDLLIALFALAHIFLWIYFPTNQILQGHVFLACQQLQIWCSVTSENAGNVNDRTRETLIFIFLMRIIKPTLDSLMVWRIVCLPHESNRARELLVVRLHLH